MNIKEIDISWNENYSIFASEHYLRSQSNEYGWIGGYDEKKLYYILPYVKFKNFLYKLVRFPTATIHVEINRTNNEKEFLEKIIEYFKEKNIDLILPPQTNAIFNTFPDNSSNTEFGTYKIKLKRHEEDLWNNIHSKHKNKIRKGLKSGIQILNDKKYSDIAYSLIRDTLSRSKMKFMPKSSFLRLMNNLKNNLEIFIAFHDNIPQGCAVVPYSKYSAYYLFGGSTNKPSTGSLNYLQWEIMKYFNNKDINYYDMVGARVNPQKNSKLEGIQKFKKRFGAELYKGYLWKYSYNKIKEKGFSIIYKLTRNKNGDIIEQENKKR